MGFPGGEMVNNPPANSGDAGLVPGLERSPEEGNGSSLMPWEILQPEEPGRLQSTGSQRVGHD